MSRGARPRTVRAVVLTLLGAVLLGTLAAALALREYPTYRAEAQVRVLRDPVVVGQETARSELDADQFLVGELLVLDGRSDVGDVGEQVLRSGEDLSATRVGDTDVVEVAGTAGSPARAARITRDAIDRYRDQRAQDLRERFASLRGEVERQVASTTSRLEGLSGASGVTADVQRGALSAEYTRLLQEQNSLQLASDAAGRLVQVVRAADARDAAQTVDPVRSWGFGALGGGVLGCAAAVGLSSWRRRVDGLEDMLELAPDLALPTVPHLTGRVLAEEAGTALAQHYAVLRPTALAPGSAGLVVVGPEPGVGATTVSVGLAVAGARRSPTVLLAAGDVLDDSAAGLLGVDLRALETLPAGSLLPTRVEGLSYACVAGRGPRALADLTNEVVPLLSGLAERGGSVVVDAPALSTSPLALELARLGSPVLLVGGVEQTEATQLHAAAASLRRVGASLAGVVLSTPFTGLLRRRRRS